MFNFQTEPKILVVESSKILESQKLLILILKQSIIILIYMPYYRMKGIPVIEANRLCLNLGFSERSAPYPKFRKKN